MGSWSDWNPASYVVDPVICWLNPSAERCQPIPSLSTVINAPVVDCNQSGWSGDRAACEAANAAARAELQEIARRESVENPDAYRAWWEAAGSPPDVPAPPPDWEKWAWYGGIAAVAVITLKVLVKR